MITVPSPSPIGAGVPTLAFRQWRQAHPSVLWAYAGSVDPVGRHLMSMRTQRMTAWLITRGKVELMTDENKMVVNRGWWVFFCGRFQKHDFSANATVVSISLRLPEDMESVWQHVPFKIKAADNPELEQTARKLIRTIDDDSPRQIGPRLPDHPMSLEKAMAVSSVGLEWAAAYLKCRRVAGVNVVMPNKQGNAKVAEAVKHLTTQSFEHGYSEANLAKKIGISPGHLEQLFVKELGTTPRRLWEQNRREEALRRVTHSDIDLKQIAYELGFSSQAHFSSWFRKSFAHTPREWRRDKRPAQSQ